MSHQGKPLQNVLRLRQVVGKVMSTSRELAKDDSFVLPSHVGVTTVFRALEGGFDVPLCEALPSEDPFWTGHIISVSSAYIGGG